VNAKKRILFVDDVSLVLQGLQRMLRNNDPQNFQSLNGRAAANVLIYESRRSDNGTSGGQIDAEYLGELGLSDRPDAWRMTLRESKTQS
jgi:hypothetical protein